MEDAEAAGCEGLVEEDCDWLEGAEETEDDWTLDEEEWLGAGKSFGWGCFLGMVKVDLVTLKAPVIWTGPGDTADEDETVEGTGFLDLEVLKGEVDCFFDGLLLLMGVEGFLPLLVILASLWPVDLLLPLGGVLGSVDFFSGGPRSFLLFSSSLSSPSLGPVETKQLTLKTLVADLNKHLKTSDINKGDVNTLHKMTQIQAITPTVNVGKKTYKHLFNT